MWTSLLVIGLFGLLRVTWCHILSQGGVNLAHNHPVNPQNNVMQPGFQSPSNQGVMGPPGFMGRGRRLDPEGEMDWRGFRNALFRGRNPNGQTIPWMMGTDRTNQACGMTRRRQFSQFAFGDRQDTACECLSSACDGGTVDMSPSARQHCNLVGVATHCCCMGTRWQGALPGVSGTLGGTPGITGVWQNGVQQGVVPGVQGGVQVVPGIPGVVQVAPGLQQGWEQLAQPGMQQVAGFQNGFPTALGLQGGVPLSTGGMQVRPALPGGVRVAPGIPESVSGSQWQWPYSQGSQRLENIGLGFHDPRRRQ